MKHGIKISHLNIRTLLPNLDQIRSLISNERIHILCLNETRLDHTISDSEISIPGFSVFRNDRDRHGGGVAVYISNSLSYSVIDNLFSQHLEMVWLQVRSSCNKPFLLCSVYKPSRLNNIINNIIIQ